MSKSQIGPFGAIVGFTRTCATAVSTTLGVEVQMRILDFKVIKEALTGTKAGSPRGASRAATPL